MMNSSSSEYAKEATEFLGFLGGSPLVHVRMSNKRPPADDDKIDPDSEDLPKSSKTYRSSSEIPSNKTLNKIIEALSSSSRRSKPEELTKEAKAVVKKLRQKYTSQKTRKNGTLFNYSA